MTPMRIPDRKMIFTVPERDLIAGWDQPSATIAALRGWTKLRFETSVGISVPSAIVRNENIYVLNPAHPDFKHIEFLPSESFQFDPRLK